MDHQIVLSTCLTAIEEKLGWGASSAWTHQDFLRLSEEILEETGQSLSYVTLKRVWGKVSYDSKPTTNTLDVLASFLGYDNWRHFASAVEHPPSQTKHGESNPLNGINRRRWGQIAAIGGAIVILLLLFPSLENEPQFNPDDFHFSSATVRSVGIPNSVIFDIDALKSPFDSIEVQQSWDPRLRKTLPKEQRQHTSIYFYPGYFQAKLLIGGTVVKEHDIHIMSDGWYAAVAQEPVPVYFQLEELRTAGKLQLSEEALASKGIDMQPQAPVTRIGVSQDFAQLKTDNFYCKARLRHTYAQGSAACQLTYVYILAEEGIMKIPLVSPGCVSAVDLRLQQYFWPGDQHDLSAFGVDFSDVVELEIEAIRGKVEVRINGQVVRESPGQVAGYFIRALDFRCEGLLEIEDVYLGRTEGDWVMAEDFE
ncbi:MAG: hypothetical protein AAFY48_02290 [Bacteroidota bacterium]